MNLFIARYDISSIDLPNSIPASNQWRVIGNIEDATGSYLSDAVSLKDKIVMRAWSITGTMVYDRYEVVNIVSASGKHLVVDIQYEEPMVPNDEYPGPPIPQIFGNMPITGSFPIGSDLINKDLVRIPSVYQHLIDPDYASGMENLNFEQIDEGLFPIDINRCGFMNQTETSISFDGVKIFTLSGVKWSYYRAGRKYTISGDKTIDLTTIDAVLENGAKYFIYIDNTLGNLQASKIPWTLLDAKIPVAIIAWNNTLTPKYFLQEERHTILIDRRDHYYLHTTRGTQYGTGGELAGWTASTNTNAANTFSIAQAVMDDEDIIITIPPKNDGNGADPTNYLVMNRNGSIWDWTYSDMPFRYTTNGYINWDSNGVLTQGTGGAGSLVRYYNTFLVLTNTIGEGRHVLVTGQHEYTTPESAYLETFGDLSLVGFPKTEWLALYQFTWKTGLSSLTNKGKCQLARAPQRIVTSSITASATTPVDHNSLTGLQGGVATEYYHLTQPQHIIATQPSSTSLSGYLTNTDWNTFNSKQAFLGGTGFVKSTAGIISYDISTYSPTSHTHYQLYQPNATNPFVYTDNSGQLHIDGNIIQNGSAYETHAEQVYTKDDYIILRDGAVAALAAGAYAGFKALKYDGVNDGHLVFDNTGTARVGDSGSEQPLTTRIESPVDGYLAIWDNVNKRLNFIIRNTSSIPSSTDKNYVTDAQLSALHPAVTIGSANGLTLSTQQLSLGLSSTTTTGALSSTDWNTFNNKQPAGNYLTANQNITLSSEASGSGSTSIAVTLSNSAVIGKVLTGYTATSGTISAADSLLQAIQKLGYDKHVAVTLGTANGLALNGQQLSLGLASSIANGALSSTDWSTFNGKQAALSGTGIVKSTAGTISYLADNSANWNTAYGWGNHSGLYAPISGSANYIQNQNASAQTANMWISGSGTFGNRSTIKSFQDNIQLVLGRTGNSIGEVGIGSSDVSYFHLYDMSTFAQPFRVDRNGNGTFLGTVTASNGQLIGGTGTTNYLPKWTGAGTLGNSPVYTDGTNVGIGIISPVSRLHITAPSNYTGLSDVIQRSSIFLSAPSSSDYGLAIAIDNNAPIIQGTYGTGATAISINPLGGNVGIGTVSPSEKLHVVGRGYFTDGITVDATGTFDYGVRAIGSAGGARDILIAGQSGYSNGFTVQYTGSAMAYSFQNGNVSMSTTTASTSVSTGALVVGGGIGAGGDIWANKFIKNGGTSAQYLLADGSTTTVAGSVYKGELNGSTGTPVAGGSALANGTGTTGWYYAASVAGTYNYGGGNITLAVGDQLYYNGTVWLRIPGAGSYTLPVATGSTLGGVKSSSTVSVDGGGVMSVSTAYDATGTASGLLSTHNSTYNHGNIANGQTAYTWGNHANGGYQSAATAITTSNIGSQSVSYADYAGYVSSSITFNNSGAGSSSGVTFNGSLARTISYNTIGAAPASSAFPGFGTTHTTAAYGDHTHIGAYDNYSYWSIAASGTAGSGTVSSAGSVTISGAGSASVTRSGTNITVTATDTDTNWYPTGTSWSAGTLTISGVGMPNVTANLDGRYLLLTGGALTGAVTSSSTISAVEITATSDRRRKFDIKPIELSPISAEYVSHRMIDYPDQLRYGVLAQDLMKDNPELVRGSDLDGYTVNYIDLLIKEVAYLKAEVKKLKSAINGN